MESIASPCINVCRMDETTGLCQGCCRTLEEIAAWSSAGQAERRAILADVERRRRVSDTARPNSRANEKA